MKKTIILCALMLKKVILVAAVFAAAQVEAETVKIGVILPLSGNNANLGRPQLQAVELIEDKLARTETIHDYVFEVQDDVLEPRRSVEAAQQLINLQKVKALTSFSSGCGNAISPIAQRSKVIHIANAASDSNVARGKYNHTNWTRPEAEAALFAKYAQKRGAKKIAFITVRQQGIMAIVDEAQKSLKEIGAQSKSFNYNPNERDFRAILYKVEAYKPDLLMLESFSPAGEIIMRQYAQLGMTIPVSSIETFELTDDKTAFEGLSYVAGAAPTEEFAAAIEAKFPGESHQFAAIAYDSFDLLVEAFESSPTADIEEALATLQSVKDRPSAVGNLTVDKDGVIHSPAGLYRMVGGTPQPITLEDLEPIK